MLLLLFIAGELESEEDEDIELDPQAQDYFEHLAKKVFIITSLRNKTCSLRITENH